MQKEFIKTIKSKYLIIISIIFPIVIFVMSWSTLIIDHHGFRQTQTALTAVYIENSVNLVQFQTPVFGYPWVVPMEYPIYQIITYHFSVLTGLDIENSGRIISILSLYLMLFPLSKIIDIRKKENELFYVCFLTSPIIVFYSSRFLIETLSLLLSLTAFVIYQKFIVKREYKYIIAFIIIGTLAGLQKITTFLPVLAGCTLLALFDNRTIKSEKISKFKIIINLLVLFLAFLIPLGWVVYGDFYKNEYYILQYLTSEALSYWNYGSIETRLNLFNILKVFGYRIILLGGIIFLLLRLHFNKLFFKDLQIIPIAWILTGLIGPLIFFNLYLIHDYYSVASILFLAIGLFLLANTKINHNNDSENKKSILILITNLSIFFYIYFPYIDKIPSSHEDMFKSAIYLKKNTQSDDVILSIGADWDSTIPYYSERKAIMFPSWPKNDTSPQIKGKYFDPNEVIHNLRHYLDGKAIGAVIFCKTRATPEDYYLFKYFKSIYTGEWLEQGDCNFIVLKSE